MAEYAWPKQTKLVGTRVPRTDGALKATGRAKYTFDINRPGMLFAVLVPSPHAHAVVEAIDTSAAERMPGVKGIHIMRNKGAEIGYAGESILAIAAETEVQAYDAARSVKIQFKVLPHAVKESIAKAPAAPKVIGKDNNVISGRATKEPADVDLDKTFSSAAAVVEGDYGMPAISHMCLEAHGVVAEWSGDKLTVWCSTQATQGVAQGFARSFSVPDTNVNCITHFMGGGFGSKFQPGDEGIAAAHLAKKTGRPVKLMLDRAAEHSAGIRPPISAHIKAAANKDGKLIAFWARGLSSSGVGGGNTGHFPYVYPAASRDVATDSVRINQHVARAYRAPNHPQSCFITESVMDDLAAKLGMDPLEFRLKNLPGGLVGEIYRRELAIGAELIGWKTKYHLPGQGGRGPIKRGLGLGIHQWGGRGVPNEQMLVEINADGSVLVRSSTQDLGTGNRTVLAIVAAEVLGLRPDRIRAEIGESQWARSHGSGGSTTCPSTAPATLIAATDARDKLFQKIAPAFNAKPEDLQAEDGQIKVKGGGTSMAWADAVRKLGTEKISVVGEYTGALLQKETLSSNGVGGCQFAEVEVDTETGEVRPIEIVAVQDCGLIINRLACESQVAGGVIMALNAALYEERVMDQATGHLLNADMEFYKLGSIGDMPKITVHMFDDPISQSRGVIGIGEPPTISGAAAIANAVFNAIGARVPFAPITPRRVLAALTQAKGGVA
jgi:xanthine dehydrogenase YagR molybdenum-binding subunit